MAQRLHASHRIVVDAAVDQAFMLFTPASRTSLVEVRCVALDEARTEVRVSYELTALNAAGEQVLEVFEDERFAAMIDDWARRIAACRELLLAASIR
jgi:hypothetical protein